MIGGNRADDEALQDAVSRRKLEQPPGGGGAALANALASSRHWSASTESRIVRVSRVFGGKDRHSKVRTVKGLRDRRVRLSVPTAIQLYDLQDRLGLSQPSKVVDWLLDAAQHEIDKLPPLQFPPQDHLVHGHHHLPSSMAMAPPFADQAAAASTTSILVDGVGDKGLPHCDDDSDLKGFMSLNNSLGLVDAGAATVPSLAHALYHYAADQSWSYGGVHEASDHHRAAPHQVTAHHSPFPSLLSLAPMSQLVFYSSEAGAFGGAMKEAADDPFPVDNLDDSQGQLSLSSARSFLHSGSHG